MTLALAYSGRSHMDALIVRSLLESEGLHPHVPGGELMDEFATASRATGGMAEVYVPAAELDAAREILAAEQDVAAAGEETPEPPKRVPVYRAPDTTAAGLMKGLLEGAGLKAWSPSELDPNLAPEVWVEERDRERAREILDAWVEAMRPVDAEE